jgi:serine/threonine-protein kinase
MMSAKKGRVFAPGNVIEGKWVVFEWIGKGAMGEVYRAHQLNLQRDVAIKAISQELLESMEENE